jgi:hypothetical protein
MEAFAFVWFQPETVVDPGGVAGGNVEFGLLLKPAIVPPVAVWINEALAVPVAKTKATAELAEMVNSLRKVLIIKFDLLYILVAN